MGFRILEEQDAPRVPRPQPTMSPRDVLRVFEEFVRRDRRVRRQPRKPPQAERGEVVAGAPETPPA